MAKKINNTGFSLIEVLIVLVVFILLVVASAFFYELRNKDNGTAVSVSAGPHLTIKRENPLNQPGVSNFSKTVSRASAVTLLSDVNSLKSAPQGVYNCPLDDGVKYTLSFTNPTLSASAPARGCQFVTINGKLYQSTDKFWKDVSSATQQPKDPNQGV